MKKICSNELCSSNDEITGSIPVASKLILNFFAELEVDLPFFEHLCSGPTADSLDPFVWDDLCGGILGRGCSIGPEVSW